MNPHEEQLARVEQKIDAIYTSVEKTRKYMLVTVIITVVTIVIPLLIAAVMVPMAMSTFSTMYQI